MIRFTTVAVLVTAFATGAGAQQPVAKRRPADVPVKYLHINMATGERRVSDFDDRLGRKFWGYEFSDDSTFYMPLASSDGSSWFPPHDNTEINDQGALSAAMTVGGFRFWYYPAGLQSASATGIAIVWNCYPGYDGCSSTGTTPVNAGLRVEGLPADPTFSWIVDVDLVNSGLEFDLPAGPFAYSFFYDMSATTEPCGLAGPIIVKENLLTAPGSEFNYASWLTPQQQTFNQCWMFGDGLYSQFHITLFDTCLTDFNGDGFVTGDDFDSYVIAFEAGDFASDFNSDGFVTGDDFDGFVAAFELGC